LPPSTARRAVAISSQFRARLLTNARTGNSHRGSRVTEKLNELLIGYGDGDFVLVNGRFVVDAGKPTMAKPGRVLQRQRLASNHHSLKGVRMGITLRGLRRLTTCVLVALTAAVLFAQPPQQPDWAKIEKEALEHFQTLVRFNTADPPGVERPAAEYLKQVLDANGIPAQILELEERRSNVLARLKGSGKKQPLLIMGHLDTVSIDEKKWSFPPFGATRDGGYVYGRGTVDDKDNATTALMAMLTLKRLNVTLDRD